MHYDAVMLKARAFDQAGDALIAIDREGTICGWSAKAVDLFGHAEEAAIGQHVSLIIPERLREPHERGFQTAMREGHLMSDGMARRTKAIRADGEPVYVTMTFAVLTDDAGRSIGAVAVARPDAAR